MQLFSSLENPNLPSTIPPILDWTLSNQPPAKIEPRRHETQPSRRTPTVTKLNLSAGHRTPPNQTQPPAIEPRRDQTQPTAVDQIQPNRRDQTQPSRRPSSPKLKPSGPAVTKLNPPAGHLAPPLPNSTQPPGLDYTHRVWMPGWLPVLRENQLKQC